MRIDLNADVGEGGDDAALLPLVSSANVACGWHAGDAATMRATVRAAVGAGVAIGAHPSYPDRKHFGRRELTLPATTVHAALVYQIRTLIAIAQAEGTALQHVKPHGALYNQAARDPALASTVVAAIRDVDPRLGVIGLAGSELIAAARSAGLDALEEAFADRRYNADGSLVARSHPDAVIEDAADAVAQTLALVQSGRIIAIDGTEIAAHADTLCLHGDNPRAILFAQRLRHALTQAGIAISSRTSRR